MEYLGMGNLNFLKENQVNRWFFNWRTSQLPQKEQAGSRAGGRGKAGLDPLNPFA